VIRATPVNPMLEFGLLNCGVLNALKASARNSSRRLQFRAEAFNAFNTPQFNNPNSSIGFSGVARITSAGSPTVYQRTSRQIQLAVKLYF